MPLGGVLVLFCAATSKVHPADVISVLYPVSRGEAAGSAGEGGSGLVRRAWRHRWHHDALLDWKMPIVYSSYTFSVCLMENSEGGLDLFSQCHSDSP